jgi:2-methylcitrate dehydratase PrpD
MVNAQFSLPYALAALALGIRPGGEWFEQQTMTRNDLRRLQRRVVAVVDPEIDALMTGPLRRPSARADVCANGRNFASRLFEYPSGSAESPISEAAVHTKFVSNVAPVFGQQVAAQLLARFTALEVETRMQPLLRLCRIA